MKKILSLLLALAALLLTSCAIKPIESTEEEKRVVGSIGDTVIAYEEFRFMANTYKRSIVDSYGESVFDDPELSKQYADKIREYVYENITFNYAVLTMCRDLGLDPYEEVITNAVQAEVEKRVSSLGSFKEYKKYLKENYLTDNVYRENIRVEIMQNELYYVCVDDLGFIESDPDKVYDIIKSDFVRTQHIYVSKNTSGALDKINSAYTELEAGADFWSMVNKYGEDAELTEAGEYITRGYMSNEYEVAAYALSVGGYSEIIESDNGYFIVKRLEQDPLYLMVNLSMLTERYQRYAFLNMIYDEQRRLEFVPNDYLKGLDILNLQ